MLLGLVLFYVGAALFINGLALFGKISLRESAIMNVFTGGTALAVSVYSAFFIGSELALQTSAYTLLFAFTFLWSAYNSMTGQDGRGLGWFYLFAALTAAAIAVDQIAYSKEVFDYWLTFCWIGWALLWFSYFILNVFKPAVMTRPVAWLTVMLAVVTGWLPGYMLLSGHMPL